MLKKGSYEKWIIFFILKVPRLLGLFQFSKVVKKRNKTTFILILPSCLKWFRRSCKTSIFLKTKCECFAPCAEFNVWGLCKGGAMITPLHQAHLYRSAELMWGGCACRPCLSRGSSCRGQTAVHKQRLIGPLNRLTKRRVLVGAS